MESLFDKYNKMVRAIDSLPQSMDPNGLRRPQRVIGWSLRGLLKFHIKGVVKLVFFFPIEVWRSRRFFWRTKRLKYYGLGKKAIVIGNGPSKGYLNCEILDNFVISGGETIVVNNWASDSNFSAHVPNWIVFSDPVTFDARNIGSSDLIGYLKIHPEIKVLISSLLLKNFLATNLKNSFFVFIDTECSFLGNINPLFPRSYLSMTLYKALACVHFMNYSKIGVIGMDNTYVRNIYSNIKNDVLEVQENSGMDVYVRNASNYYFNIAARLDDLTRLFNDLKYFPKERIYNLDQFSLTDRFDKIKIEEFLNI